MNETKGESSMMEKYLTPIAVVVGALIIAGAFAFGSGAKKADTGAEPAAQAVDIKDVKIDKSPVLGDASAPVTMAVWYDYQCPFCKQLELNVTAQIYEQYVKTGKVKIVLKDFQFLGKDSDTAAEFGRAMWEAYPDKYYEWHKAVFVAQDDEGDKGFGDLESIQALTAKIPGVDVAKVTKLMTDKKAEYAALIAADRAEGQAMGINGTPAVIIGKKVLSGAQPLAAVTALLDAELKK